MDRDWERKKSIVNGQYMRAMKDQVDTEYQAYLRHQEREREQAEFTREKQAVSRHNLHLTTSIYSARSYSKPWQTGMTIKSQVPRRSGNEQRHTENQSTKLPLIEKEKQPLRKRAVSHTGEGPQTQQINTASQPRFTVEKKKVHARPPSSKPIVTHGRDATGRGGYGLKRQGKTKEPKRKVQHQKNSFEEQEKTDRLQNNPLTTQHPCSGLNPEDLHDSAFSPLSTSLQELREEPPTISGSTSPRVSSLQTSEGGFNEMLKKKTEVNFESSEEPGLNDDLNEDMSFSANSSRVPLPLRPPIYNTLLTEPEILENTELDAETISENEGEEEISDININYDMDMELLESTTYRVETARCSPLRTLTFLPALTSPMSLREDGPAIPQSAGHTHNSHSDSFLNLRDMTGLQRMGIALAPLSSSPVEPETTLPLIFDINANRDIENQTYFRTADNGDATIPVDETSSNLHVAPQELNFVNTSLHENLDLIFHTISMQRQSERRNLEGRVRTSLDKENLKPKSDPEKLQKLQESLLEEDSEEEGDLCRICLTAGETSKNQLTAPCKCTGSLKYVHTECMKKWLLSKIQSGAELSAVRTCEICREKVECDFEGFSVSEQYRSHQQSQAALNPRLYLVLLLHLYQQRYEELLQLSNTRDRVHEEESCCPYSALLPAVIND